MQMLGITNTATICRRKISLRGAPTSRMGMTTVWRPRVRIAVPNVGDAENTDTSREESTKKGTKRKRAPPSTGAVRARGEASLEGARCAVGVRTVVGALCARSAVGHQSASTVVGALSARSAVGHQSASTVVGALSARSAVGQQSASTVVSAISARSAVVQESASTVVERSHCKECGGSQICEHGRQRHTVQGVSKRTRVIQV